MKETPLFEIHKQLKAKMAPFAGWLMPIQYEGIISEHLWTRKSCSLFDTCHMGEIIVYGDLKKSNLDKIITANLENMDIGKCSYSFMLNERGG
ncbi:MAG TPA: glycine cleavage system protein T, partial [Candidatus Desulfofervidus auxilii]|nr:glycine cleavage system protein T [Candidatus Desulfofervidus auxilii]